MTLKRYWGDIELSFSEIPVTALFLLDLIARFTEDYEIR